MVTSSIMLLHFKAPPIRGTFDTVEPHGRAIRQFDILVLDQLPRQIEADQSARSRSGSAEVFPSLRNSNTAYIFSRQFNSSSVLFSRAGRETLARAVKFSYVGSFFLEQVFRSRRPWLQSFLA